MDKEKFDISDVASGAEKAAGGLAEKAKNALFRKVDRNKDGKVDFQDVTTVADQAAGAAGEKAGAVKEGVRGAGEGLENSALKPVLEGTLENPNFILPTMIRIVGMDPKYAGMDSGKGAVGFLSEYKDFRLFNVFRERLDALDLTFYPDACGEFYYVDSGDFDRYIALDEYFGYLKTARLGELQCIAESLGASHFRVTYIRQKAQFASRRTESGLKSLGKLFTAEPAPVDAATELASAPVEHMEFAAEMDLEGHEPAEPELHYFRKDPAVKQLIEARMSPDAQQPEQKCTLKLMNSCGIKPGTAAKIDAVLKDLKFAGNSTVSCEAMNEGRRFFEFEVTF